MPDKCMIQQAWFKFSKNHMSEKYRSASLPSGARIKDSFRITLLRKQSEESIKL